MDAQANVRFERQQKSKLAERAERHGLSLSDALRLGAETYLDNLDRLASATLSDDERAALEATVETETAEQTAPASEPTGLRHAQLADLSQVDIETPAGLKVLGLSIFAEVGDPVLTPPGGESGDSPDTAEAVTAGTPFRATLAQEGIPTDDGRQIEKGALEWRTLPLTLMAIIEDSHGGMPQTRTAVSGRIDTIERVDTGDVTADIIGTGVFDTGTVGAEIARLVTDKMMRGVSIDLAVKESEEVISSGEDAPEGAIEDPFFGGSFLMIVKQGVILGATVCPFPAFGDADIETLLASGGVLPRVAIPSVTYNEQDHVVRMTVLGEFAPDPNAPPTDANPDPDNDGDDDLNPLVGASVDLSVSVDELPTAEILAGVDPTSLAVTYKGSELNILTCTLTDPDGNTLDLPLGKPLTASAAGMVPVDPPLSWFDYPADIEQDTLIGMTVTPEGRVYGHVAVFNECHLGHPGTCVTAPHHFRADEKGLCDVCGKPEMLVDHSISGYEYFHLGEIQTAEGEPVRVGTITIGTGHAPTTSRTTAKQAQAHYDDTGTGAADVRLYEDNVGVMGCGALRPEMPAAKVREFRASKPSGDWRVIRGRREMVGILGTNVPGFAVRRGVSENPDGEMRELALVAAGFPDSAKVGTKAECRDGSVADLVARARMPALIERGREALR